LKQVLLLTGYHVPECHFVERVDKRQDGPSDRLKILDWNIDIPNYNLQNKQTPSGK
jgi:hypothetical protein